MSRRFQFSLKWLFVVMLAIACFFGGVRCERERIKRLMWAEAAIGAEKRKAERAWVLLEADDLEASDPLKKLREVK